MPFRPAVLVREEGVCCPVHHLVLVGARRGLPWLEGFPLAESLRVVSDQGFQGCMGLPEHRQLARIPFTWRFLILV